MMNDRKEASTQLFPEELNTASDLRNIKHAQAHTCMCQVQAKRTKTLSISHSYNISIFVKEEKRSIKGDLLRHAQTGEKLLPVPIRKPMMRCAESAPNIVIAPSNFETSGLHMRVPSAAENSVLELKIDCQRVGVQKQNMSDKSVTNLRALQELLCSIFKGESLVLEHFKLKKPELHILVEIFIRKNRSACASRIGKEITVNEIYEWTQMFIQEVSPKRFEENIKFVFKLAFKKLKSSLLRKNCISFYSKKFDSQFYSYYFAETAKQLNISIEEFYDPLNHKGALKTLNNEYLRLVFNSPSFKRDFLEYLSSGRLVTDYHDNLKRKIRQLLVKFDALCKFDDAQATDRSIAAVQQYFRMNRQCKLPWLNIEVVTAIQTFMFMLNSL